MSVAGRNVLRLGQGFLSPNVRRRFNSSSDEERRIQQLRSFVARGEVLLKHRFDTVAGKRSVHRRWVTVDLEQFCFCWSPLQKEGAKEVQRSQFYLGELGKVTVGISTPVFRGTGKQERRSLYFSLHEVHSVTGDDTERTGDFECVSPASRTMWVDFFTYLLNGKVISAELAPKRPVTCASSLWSDRDTSSREARRLRKQRTRDHTKRMRMDETAIACSVGVGCVLKKHRIGRNSQAPFVGQRYVWIDLKARRLCWTRRTNLLSCVPEKVHCLPLSEVAEVRIGMASAVLEKTGRGRNSDRYFSLFLESFDNSIDFECEDVDARNRWVGFLGGYLEGSLKVDLDSLDVIDALGAPVFLATAASEFHVALSTLLKYQFGAFQAAEPIVQSLSDTDEEERGMATGRSFVKSSAPLEDVGLSRPEEERLLSSCRRVQKGENVLIHFIQGGEHHVLARLGYVDFRAGALCLENESEDVSDRKLVRIRLVDISELLVGRSSDVFREHGLADQEDVYFSLVVEGNDDLVNIECDNAPFCTVWVGFFAALLSGLLSGILDEIVERNEGELLSHSDAVAKLFEIGMPPPPPVDALPPPPPLDSFSAQLDSGVSVFRKRGSLRIPPSSLSSSSPMSLLDEIKSPAFKLKKARVDPARRRSLRTETMSLPILLERTISTRRFDLAFSSDSSSQDSGEDEWVVNGT